MAVDKEREISIMEEEFTVKSFDGDRNYVFAGHEVQRGIGMIEKGLGFCCFQTYNFEAFGAGDAKLRP